MGVAKMPVKGTVQAEPTSRFFAPELPVRRRLLRSQAARFVVAGLVVVLGYGCSPASESPTADTRSAIPSDSLPSAPSFSSEPSSSEPSAIPSTSPTPSGAAVTVAFVGAVSTKHWGDLPFTVKAKASNGAKLSFSATGGCAIGKSSGVVAINSVGNCTLLARTASGPAASASLTFAIGRATTKIQFGDQTVRYTRTFSYRVKVKVTPLMDLTYRILTGTSDPECRVGSATGKLTLAGNQPNLRAQCTIEVAATRQSGNYTTPSPVHANVKVDFPAWDVRATSPPTVYWSATPTVTVVVRETTGNAFGIDVEQNGGAGECTYKSETPVDPPAGTKLYYVVLDLQKPSTPEGYVCNMTAKGSPPDYFDPGGNAADNFTVTVVP